MSEFEPEFIDDIPGKPMMEFPCHFPVIAMGINSESFRQHVEDLVEEVTGKPVISLSCKESRNRKYLSVKVDVYAQSKEQLDEIYKAFSKSPHVLTVL